MVQQRIKVLDQTANFPQSDVNILFFWVDVAEHDVRVVGFVIRKKIVNFKKRCDLIVKLRLVFVVNKAISEHSVGLVEVQRNQVVSVRSDAFKGTISHTLDDFAEVAQVESVVALSWSGKEFFLGFVVNINSRLDNRLSDVLNAIVILNKETLED